MPEGDASVVMTYVITLVGLSGLLVVVEALFGRRVWESLHLLTWLLVAGLAIALAVIATEITGLDLDDHTFTWLTLTVLVVVLAWAEVRGSPDEVLLERVHSAVRFGSAVALGGFIVSSLDIAGVHQFDRLTLMLTCTVLFLPTGVLPFFEQHDLRPERWAVLPPAFRDRAQQLVTLHVLACGIYVLLGGLLITGYLHDRVAPAPAAALGTLVTLTMTVTSESIRRRLATHRRELVAPAHPTATDPREQCLTCGELVTVGLDSCEWCGHRLASQQPWWRRNTSGLP
jgi:hypothetical protein